MIVEYIILLTFFALVVSSVIVGGLKGTFTNSGPLLGARVEKHIETGTGFKLGDKGRGFPWEQAPKKPGEVSE